MIEVELSRGVTSSSRPIILEMKSSAASSVSASVKSIINTLSRAFGPVVLVNGLPNDSVLKDRRSLASHPAPLSRQPVNGYLRGSGPTRLRAALDAAQKCVVWSLNLASDFIELGFVALRHFDLRHFAG